MGLKWSDAEEIAILLHERHPEIDPRYIRYTDLHRWVLDLDDFTDEAQRSGEKLLEAIQMAWIEEADSD
ncbi:Fe-S assembly protein IscX [Acidiferrobacter sp. SPIII_3]|jgi:FeS assembly protein IscX|uniref:Fe-S cluster assembly protein IscX n=1 Tax=Acidiferrobacter sp. SPIII_3 TaxID=1281578 RepID=UPI000D725C5F|nr:Fe-S cluster assembly protein IscX [Acidiferrobacter sp. SPIII_3]AWP23760.1 Fe-S assembly protein IscX [Acidiferrobacter sp. SPIII_3]